MCFAQPGSAYFGSLDCFEVRFGPEQLYLVVVVEWVAVVVVVIDLLQLGVDCGCGYRLVLLLSLPKLECRPVEVDLVVH